MKIGLTDKLALVKGKSDELGRVIVRTLAEYLANVIIHYMKNVIPCI